MRDLTEQLATDIARANNVRRLAEDEAQREWSEAVEAAHQRYHQASTQRVAEAQRDMEVMITFFLGQRPQGLPDVADGPLVVTHVEDYSEAAQ